MASRLDEIRQKLLEIKRIIESFSLDKLIRKGDIRTFANQIKEIHTQLYRLREIIQSLESAIKVEADIDVEKAITALEELRVALDKGGRTPEEFLSNISRSIDAFIAKIEEARAKVELAPELIAYLEKASKKSPWARVLLEELKDAYGSKKEKVEVPINVEVKPDNLEITEKDKQELRRRVKEIEPEIRRQVEQLKQTITAKVPYQITFSSAKEAFPGIDQYLRDLGIEVDRIKDEIQVTVKNLSDGIKRIEIEGAPVIYFREDIQRFSTSLRDLRNAFSQAQLNAIAEQFGNVAREAQRLGFSLQDLKRVDEIAKGVNRFVFAQKTAEGITRRLILYVDDLGNVTADTSKRFLTFGDSIIRNTIEAFRWTFAITLVYRGLNVLNDALRMAIENQERLASIAVVLGRGTESFSQIFDSAFEISQELGIRVGEVLEGYVGAMRVAGTVARDFANRQRVAQEILREAAILSRITGQEMSESMDLLISVARQLNVEFTELSSILNKWVFLSQEGQVTAEDLAEAMAVVGAIAKTAGLDFDELAGVIAALAESLPDSGREIGNILRSIFSNIQSDEVQRQLLQFGISLRDTEGEMRNFFDIMDEIKRKFDAGIIDEAELAKIGRIIGGGARRGPQFVTLIKNLDRANENIEKLRSTTLDSDYAFSQIGAKIETVDAQLARLSNSFQRFSSVLGDRGGALTATENFIKAATWIMDKLSALISAIGPAGVAGTLSLFSTKLLNTAYSARFFGAVIDKVISSMQKLRIISAQLTEEELTNLSTSLTRKATKILSVGLVASLGLAFGRSKAEAIGGSLGAIIGGIVGSAVGGIGTVAGAIIGQVIGSEAGRIVNEVVSPVEREMAPQIRKILAEAFREGIKEGTEEGLSSAIPEIEQQILENVPRKTRVAWDIGSLLQVDNLVGYAMKGIIMFADLFGKEIDEAVRKQADMLLSRQFQEAIPEEKMLSTILFDLRKYGTQFVKQQYGLTDEDIQRLQEYLRLLNVIEAVDVSKPFASGEKALQEFGSSVEVSKDAIQSINRLQEEFRKKVENAYAAGEISAREYRDSLIAIDRFHATILGNVAGIGEALIGVSDEVKTNEDVYRRFANIMINGTDAEIERVLALIALYRRLRLERGAQDPRTREALQQIEREMDLIESNIARRQLELPVIIDKSQLSTDELELVLQEIAQLQEDYIRQAVQEGLVADETALRNYFNSIEPVFVYTKEGLLKAVGEGLDVQRFFPLALKRLQERGVLPEKLGDRFTVKFLDIPSSMRGALIARIRQLEELFRRAFPQYKFNYQDIGIVFKDYVTDILHTDLTILNLAMKDLIEINQKQLDGIYNLPAGADFWVPWEAWELAAQSVINASSGLSGAADALIQAGENLKVEMPDYAPLIEQDRRNAQAFYELMQAQKQSIQDYQGLIEQDKRDAQAFFELFDLKKLEPEVETVPTEPSKEKFRMEIYGPGLGSLFTEFLSDFGARLKQIFQELFGSLQYRDTDTSFVPGSELGALTEFAPTINLNLELKSTTTLTLDGRLLATAIKRYLLQDLLRAARGSTVSRNINVTA